MTTWRIQLFHFLPIWLVFLLTSVLPDNRVSIRIRGLLISPFLKSCGRNLCVGRDVTILNPQELRIGNDVYLAKGVWINALAGLTIQDQVVIAPYVVISTLKHTFKEFSVRFGGSKGSAIRIGRGSWLAAHSAVKSGVEIGSGVIVAANSFVVSDIEDHAIVSGVPASKVGVVRNEKADFYSVKEFYRQ